MVSDATTAVQAPDVRIQAVISKHRSAWTERAEVYGFFGVFAFLLAVITYKHEIYLDEAQAWLIARDSRNIFELFHHLRYEGHPALWYLLLYLPSHMSRNMAWMQGINYLLALGMAWLILSERRLPLAVRVLLVFSVFTFFYMGVVARSYMLASVLLIGAVRCLLAEPRRHWKAMILLGLATNTHFLAIPVMAGVFVWLYWLAHAQSWRCAAVKLKEQRFWITVAILGGSCAICYLTLRPTADLYTPQYEHAGSNLRDYLVLGVGEVWHFFVPFPFGLLSAANQELLAPSTSPSLLAALMSFSLWFVAISLLPGRRSRCFMITVSFLWAAVVIATVHIPTPFHVSFLFVGYVIALMVKPIHCSDRSWLPSRYGGLMLRILISLQVGICGIWCLNECIYPFSGAKPTAEWLRSTGLTSRPLVIEPDAAAPAVLGYTGVASAYFPSCFCRGSFVVFRRKRDMNRPVSLGELQAQRREYGSAPVLITYRKLDRDSQHHLGVRFRYASPRGWFWQYENLFVYEACDDHALEDCAAQK